MTEIIRAQYAVAGNPIEHSRSPFIHRLFAEQTGEPIEYGRLLCPLDAFVPTLREFAEGGGAGCNVTVPFKLEALKAAARSSPRAALAQAANWLRFEADGWSADNTDGAGLVRDIEVNAGRKLAGQRVLLLGAGGAAAGALGPLLEALPAQIVVANRTADKARALVERHQALADGLSVPIAVAPLSNAIAESHAPFDVVINATASSLGNAAISIPGSVVARDALVLDMMYGPAAQPFLNWATSQGAQARDGLGMLLEQAAEAFFLWRGIRPDTAPVLHALQTTSTKS